MVLSPIVAYSLSATAADIAAKTTYLLINFQGKRIIGVQGIKTNKIKLNITIDGSGNILTCNAVASGNGSNSQWTTAGNNVFYNGGVRVGDETQTNTCDSTTEGTLRYNKATHSMQYCGYNAGLP